MTTQDQINAIKDIWQAIRFRMNERRIIPSDLAHRTGYRREHIERGIKGEIIPVTLDFLRDCVTVFGLTSGRAKYYEDTAEILLIGECVSLLKPPPAMPPRQGNFWEGDQSE